MAITKYNAHQYLPIVQALAEGKDIEVRGGDGKWRTPCAGISLAFPPEDFRIKPEPRRFTILVPKPEHPLGKNAKPQLVYEGMICVSNDWEEIKVVEVMDE